MGKNVLIKTMYQLYIKKRGAMQESLKDVYTLKDVSYWKCEMSEGETLGRKVEILKLNLGGNLI